MTSVPLFWWSPPRIPRTMLAELRNSGRAWVRMAAHTRRFMLNFGDELSPLVVEHAFGNKAKWSTQREARLFAIGSIASFVLDSERAVVWGTGVRMPPDANFLRKWSKAKPIVRAIRGPLSRQALSLPSTIPMGDPGLLTPRIFPPSVPNGRAVYVSHFRDWNNRIGLKKLRRLEEHGFRLIVPTAKPVDVARAVSSADVVVSSSLHGIVLAHAYGVPSIPLYPARNEPAFKYQDHFASLDIAYNPCSLGDLLDGDLRLHVQAADRNVARAKSAAGSRAEDLLSVASLA